jgi:hypothetical protein
MAEGGGPSGALVTAAPADGIGAPAEDAAVPGGAMGVAAVGAGGLPGSTTTRVPTFARV